MSNMASFESHATFALMRDYPNDFRLLLGLNLRIADEHPEFLRNGFCQQSENTHKIFLTRFEPAHNENDKLEIELSNLLSSLLSSLRPFRPYLLVVSTRTVDPMTFAPVIQFRTMIEMEPI